MIATTGSALLGLTLACARCHDHKYDPIPTRDYYRMLSAFNAGGISEVPLARWNEAKAHREAEARWKSEMDAIKKRSEALHKEVRKAHESSAWMKKVEQLKISAEEKQ